MRPFMEILFSRDKFLNAKPSPHITLSPQPLPQPKQKLRAHMALVARPEEPRAHMAWALAKHLFTLKLKFCPNSLRMTTESQRP